MIGFRKKVAACNSVGRLAVNGSDQCSCVGCPARVGYIAFVTPKALIDLSVAAGV